MSKDIILRIVDKSGNGLLQQADLGANGLDDISITYETQNPKWDELATVSRVEQTISIPATSLNKQLLNYFHLPIAFFGAPYYFDLTARGVQLLSGTALIQNATMRGGRNQTEPTEYSLQLLGDNYDWGYALRDLLLKDLDFWDIKSEISQSEVLAGVSAQYPTQKAGYCLIRYKAWANGLNCPDLAEFTPFIFVRHIIQKIFDTIDRRINSAFFDTEEFKRYILPLPMQDKFGAEFAQDVTRVVAESNIFTPPNTLVNYNNIIINPLYGGTPLVGTTYTVGVNGYCRITSKTQHQRNTVIGTTVAGIEIWVNGALKFRYFPPLGGLLVAQVDYVSPVFVVSAGDTITVKNPQFYLFASPPNSDIIAATLTVEIDAIAGYGIYNVPVIHKYLLGDWKAKDFILGLTQMFNLVWYADRIGNVYCEPANAYVSNDLITNTSVPQSGFYNNVDLGRTQQFEDMQGAGTVENLAAEFDAFDYSFKPDANEDYTKPDKNNQSLPFGAANATGGGDGAIRIDKRENSFFSNCFHTFDMDASTPDAANSKDICQVPLLYPVQGSSNPRSFEPRLMCFYANGLNPYGTLNYTVGFVAPIQIMNYPFAFMVNYRDTTGLSPVLSYANAEINQTVRTGLFLRFFAKNLQISLNSKLINSFFYLSLSFIQSFDFRTLIYYKHTYCRCLKIEGFSPAEGAPPVKLTLTPVQINPEFTLTNSPIVGLV